MKKVIAYYMHEYELSKALEFIKEPIVTEGFVKGEISDAEVNELKKNNIIFSIIDEKPQIETPGTINKEIKTQQLNINWDNANFDNILLSEDEKNKIADEVPIYPAYYLLTIDGPLLEDYKKKISYKGVELLQYFPENTYTALLKEGDYKNLLELNFITNIKYFGAVDTGIREVKLKNLNDVIIKGNLQENYTISKSTTDSHGNVKKVEISAKPFDVNLHNPADKDRLIEWLNEKQIEVIGASKFKIRILASQESLDKYEVSKNNMVQSVIEYIPPSLHDAIVRGIIKIETNSPTTNTASDILGFAGEGEIIGVADTGIDDNHADFSGNIHKIIARGRVGNYSDPLGHGTHVAGIIAGNGTLSNVFPDKVKGIAYKSKLFFQSILAIDNKLNLPVDLSELFLEAYNEGVRIHNNSWGASTEGMYTVNSIEVDDFVYNHKDMLLVFSAGNSGNSKAITNNGFVDLFSVGSPASSKNVITVGASRSSRNAGGHAKLTYGQAWRTSFPRPPISNEHVSGNPDAMAAFSSRGPCDDNRFKPDVVAPGTDIASTKSGTASLAEFCGTFPPNPNYALMCGTSMSAPIVTGLAALVRQYFITVCNHRKPSAALLKATIINGARQLTSDDSNFNEPILPNNHQGFGLIDVSLTLPNAVNDFNLYFFDALDVPALQLKGTGEAKRFLLKLDCTDNNSWIRVCLAYTDIPARAIQNDLNLMMDFVSSGKKWLGNEGSKVPYDRFPDKTNNVEVIRIENANAGDYTIKVVAANLLKAPQDFALVITTNCKTATIQPI